jgi:eukaryotic-like serine/threonine-protein kinase
LVTEGSDDPSNQTDPRDSRAHRVIGRYALHDEIASGGMAVVHFGRLLGPVGFARSVAIKRLHSHYAKDPEFVAMFLDEARLAARIRHPNVVPTIDVVALQGELFLVMEYVQGETVARLARAVSQKGARMPSPVAVSIMVGVLHGLHAAHEARSERGEPLGIIHRDVSPQNLLVGEDGVARIVDFGIAKASWRIQSTREGQLKGKLPYMSPEQLREQPVDRRVDVYSAAVVLWELLVGRRLFDAENPAAAVEQMISKRIEAPSTAAKGVPAALDKIVLRGLARDRTQRFESARAMAIALEDAAPMATPRQVGDWVSATAGDELRKRAEVLSGIEHGDGVAAPALEPADDTTVAERRPPELATSMTDVTVESAVGTTILPASGRSTLGIVVAGLLSALLVTALWIGLRRGDREPSDRAAAPLDVAPAAPAPSAASASSAAPSPAPPEPPLVAEFSTTPPALSASAAETPAEPATTPAPASPPQETRSAPPSRSVRALPAATAASPGIVREFPGDPPPGAHPSKAASQVPGKGAPKVDCTPPYTIDAEGVRVLKHGCY